MITTFIERYTALGVMKYEPWKIVNKNIEDTRAFHSFNFNYYFKFSRDGIQFSLNIIQRNSAYFNRRNYDSNLFPLNISIFLNDLYLS